MCYPSVSLPLGETGFPRDPYQEVLLYPGSLFYHQFEGYKTEPLANDPEVNALIYSTNIY